MKPTPAAVLALVATASLDLAAATPAWTQTMSGSVSTTAWTWRQIGVSPPVLDTAVLASATGAKQPYTYQWVYVSGDTLIRPVAVASAATQFNRGSLPASGVTIQAVWRCKVLSASTGLSTFTPMVMVTFTHNTGAALMRRRRLHPS